MLSAAKTSPRSLRLLGLVLRVFAPTHASHAAAALGSDHPLVRALALRRAIGVQMLVTAIPIALGIAGMLRHVATAPVVLAATVTVDIVLSAAALFVRRLTNDRVRELIAAGDDGVVLAVVASERRRLASRKERAKLACSLERLVHDAEGTSWTFPTSGPVYSTRGVRLAAAELRGLADRLRSDAVRVQGVALTERLLVDGYASPLYREDVGALREELNRILFLLGDQRRGPRDTGDTRAAA